MNTKALQIGGALVAVFLLYFVWLGVSKLFFSGAAAVKPFAGTELSLWVLHDTTQTMQPLLDAFQNNAGVRVQVRSFANVATYRAALLTELAAGHGPDVFVFHPNWLDKYQSILAPLPAATLGYSLDDVREHFVDTVARDLIRTRTTGDGRRSPVTTTEELYGLPLYVDSLAIIYNGALFKQVAAKPSARPELDWAGFRADVQRLTAHDAAQDTFNLSGFAAGRTDNITRGAELFWTLFLQNGGGDIVNERGTVQLSQTGVEALDFFTRFSRGSAFPEYSWNASLGQTVEKELLDFVQGRVAMIAGYSYYPAQIQNLITQQQRSRAGGLINMSDVGVQLMPQLAAPTSGQPRVAMADYFAFGTAATSQKKEASWQLILFLTSPSTMQEYLNKTGRPAARTQLLAAQQQDAMLRPWAEQAVFARSMPMRDDELYRRALDAAIDAILVEGRGLTQTASAFDRYLGCLLAAEPACIFR